MCEYECKCKIQTALEKIHFYPIYSQSTLSFILQSQGQSQFTDTIFYSLSKQTYISVVDPWQLCFLQFSVFMSSVGTSRGLMRTGFCPFCNLHLQMHPLLQALKLLNAEAKFTLVENILIREETCSSSAAQIEVLCFVSTASVNISSGMCEEKSW